MSDTNETVWIQQAAKNPEEARAHLVRRMTELAEAPQAVLAGDKTAQEYMEMAAGLSGCARQPVAGEPDWTAQAQAVQQAFNAQYRKNKDAEAAYAAALKVIQELTGNRFARPASEIAAEMPQRLVWLTNKDKALGGAVISEGTVCLLAGEGGVSKTTLALQIALFAAARKANSGAWKAEPGWCGGLECRAGSVMFVGFEDPPEVCRWRLNRLIKKLDGAEKNAAQEGLAHIHFLDLSNRPLYGPPDGFGYNHRPEPLKGWWDMEGAVKKVRPVLIIVDPALAAYVGEPNSAAAVREFLSALTRLAVDQNTGVLLLAHSTKAARRSADKYDPGHIGGSAAWHDGVRGALVLARRDDIGRWLRVSKANYGPSYMSLVLDGLPAVKNGGWVGFKAAGSWMEESGDPDEADHDPGQKNGHGISPEEREALKDSM